MVRWVKQLAQSSYDIHHSPTLVTSWPCSSQDKELFALMSSSLQRPWKHFWLTILFAGSKLTLHSKVLPQGFLILRRRGNLDDFSSDPKTPVTV